MTDNVFWHSSQVSRRMQEARNGHRSFVFWFTGLSGAGKSTIAYALEHELFKRGMSVAVLDGDNIRHGLCSDLGFSKEDRNENLRRIGETAKLFVEAGTIVLAAFVSPYREDRERVRSRMPHGDFFEVYCKCDLDICEQRDPKGLYARARAGEIDNFTGISAPYEEPIKPDIVIDTGRTSIEEEVSEMLSVMQERGLVSTAD